MEEGELCLPPELWQCVFDWVGTWEGLGSVTRVCRAFHALALLQLNRRRLAFESRRTPLHPPPPQLARILLDRVAPQIDESSRAKMMKKMN
jgi:hypothetical protein